MKAYIWFNAATSKNVSFLLPVKVTLAIKHRILSLPDNLALKRGIRSFDNRISVMAN